ncbi:hypothetical protein CC85DRAFT_286992 [Cutaneotrichosporon oleaginosum]|uniref:Uncharacterized protein n=1 Tax=Cutaneotrichosporon oleaginosum TaxID=879819 RepID=A0A0J0XI90_9TREE|nr:uncharacterized protein CC85DRAFT_286992 [Cutaneotrichosporon oleaginosum]KLT40845.1 hypothetical protein CC85DRAFT_286992 [Cutaneotrichosporon oleaginosum]TXT09295.1 hypothetical protein COLE_03229 [Cutaneotrichosporon oleaginosum]
MGLVHRFTDGFVWKLDVTLNPSETTPLFMQPRSGNLLRSALAHGQHNGHTNGYAEGHGDDSAQCDGAAQANEWRDISDVALVLATRGVTPQAAGIVLAVSPGCPVAQPDEGALESELMLHGGVEG